MKAAPHLTVVQTLPALLGKQKRRTMRPDPPRRGLAPASQSAVRHHSAPGKPPPLVCGAVVSSTRAQQGAKRWLPAPLPVLRRADAGRGLACQPRRRGRPPQPASASWRLSESTQRQSPRGPAGAAAWRGLLTERQGT